MTKRLLILPLLAAFALSACGKAAQDNAAQAADSIAADANATAAEAIRDTDAATDEALGAAEARIGNVGDVIGNTADTAPARTADRAGTAPTDAGNEIER